MCVQVTEVPLKIAVSWLGRGFLFFPLTTLFCTLRKWAILSDETTNRNFFSVKRQGRDPPYPESKTTLFKVIYIKGHTVQNLSSSIFSQASSEILPAMYIKWFLACKPFFQFGLSCLLKETGHWRETLFEVPQLQTEQTFLNWPICCSPMLL